MRFNRQGKFNVPFGHKPERFRQAYITKIVNQVGYLEDAFKLNEWEFVCQDFSQTLALAEVGDFIYCDPPYTGRHVDYYSNWNESHEARLYNVLRQTPAKILSTWHSNQHRVNPYIQSFWKDFYILTHQHFYHVGASETNRKPMLEAFVTNYRPSPSLAFEPPLQLSLFEPQSNYAAD